MIDCQIAIKSCNPENYMDYDGFAIVFQWFDNNKTINKSASWGWCLPDKTCILADPTYSTYDFKQLIL